MSFLPKTRTQNVVIQETSDEVLVYDLDKNKAVCLNETSAIIWKLCDGQKSVNEIADEVGKKLKSKVNKDLVLLALDQLKNEGLLENDDDFGLKFEGLTRREIVRNIGAVSMVALPIVSAIIAPQASFAQSCVGTGTIPPNALLTNACSDTDANCQSNAVNNCCSGMARSVMQPCPSFPTFTFACECFV